MLLCLGNVCFFRELQTVNLKDVFGTEGKSNLGFFRCPYTNSQTHKVRKKYKKEPEKKSKVTTSRDIRQFI